MEVTMDKLLEILEEIIPGEDVENCKTLVDDNILDSFAIISLVSTIEEEFDITVSPAELIPDNFNSAEALWAMIEKLSD
jgi:acyl carrier protein